MANSLLPSFLRKARQPAPMVVDADPALTAAAMNRQGMNSSNSFGPGAPISPFSDNGSEPRSWDFPSGYNIIARPKRDARVSFDALRALIDSYDVARICIGHRIDDVRSLEWSIEPKQGVTSEDQLTYTTPEGGQLNAIDVAYAALKKPDGRYPFKSWLAMFLEDVLRYDAGALYRRRDRARRVIGLEVVSGTTIAPLLDFYGRRPMGDAPAYMQFVQGVPWQGMTNDDLVYVPFRPQSDSPYGFAPLETVLLTANTDIRFQMHWLGWFTEGTVPEGFAILPDGQSSPDQVEEWQQFWDALMYGDQSAKQQLKMMPHGTEFEWPKDRPFDPLFAEHLLKKVCAAYHVVPADLGFTNDVNRATGETQVDVQFRIGTLPLIQHVQGILNDYLQDDLKLPVEFRFDTGQEKEDRLTTATAWGVYIDKGMASPDEGRQQLLGLPIDLEHPTPRFYNARQGPVPLQDLRAAATVIDPETYGPASNATNIAPIHPVEVPGEGKITKEITAGITAATGLEGVDLIDVDDEDDDERRRVAKAELASFRKFARSRRREGVWRDFTFTALDRVQARRRNQDGHARVRKELGQMVAAGVALVAADTGRVLMLQRALDPTDPAGGMWEMPGGCIEDGETPLAAACREWQEETGCLLPVESLVAASFDDGARSWTSANGVYQGFVIVVPSETSIDLGGRGQVSNPDDPDGDLVEAIAWWDPALLEGNPAVRSELGSDIAIVLAALAGAVTPAEPVRKDEACPCCVGTGLAPGGAPCLCCGGDGCCPVHVCDLAPVTKAGEDGPKASWRDGAPKAPQHAYDLRLTDYWAPRVVDALHAAVPASTRRAMIDAAAGTVAKAVDPADAQGAVAAAATAGVTVKVSELETVLRKMLADAYLTGLHTAAGQSGGYIASDLGTIAAGIDWDTWTPGDAEGALNAADGGLADLLDDAGATIKGLSETTLERLGNLIAEGLAAGDAIDVIAQSLDELIDDPSRAEMIAHTETARAVDVATMDTYSANGIDQYEVLLADGACDECVDVADGNPYPVDDGGQVPIHPRCRCASAPIYVDRNGDDQVGPEDDGDDE